jgi:hypothetical protein
MVNTIYDNTKTVPYERNNGGGYSSTLSKWDSLRQEGGLRSSPEKEKYGPSNPSNFCKTTSPYGIMTKREMENAIREMAREGVKTHDITNFIEARGHRVQNLLTTIKEELSGKLPIAKAAEEVGEKEIKYARERADILANAHYEILTYQLKNGIRNEEGDLVRPLDPQIWEEGRCKREDEFRSKFDFVRCYEEFLNENYPRKEEEKAIRNSEEIRKMRETKEYQEVKRDLGSLPYEERLKMWKEISEKSIEKQNNTCIWDWGDHEVRGLNDSYIGGVIRNASFALRKHVFGKEGDKY